ncbi:LysE family translocator [Tistrella mobilis]|uniref:LysE family translocator n=1 Tax=Tistrella mobilis TaxID=171437 RepID=UPI0035573326
MPDYELNHWVTFFAATLALNLSPGPDIAFILDRSLGGRTKAGFVAMAGIWCGTLLHVLFATLGLSAILVSSSIAFTAVKWAGAGYLIWLGLRAWISSGAKPALDGGSGYRDRPLERTFRQGILVSALNPKVAVFFLAFLPQFVVADAGPVSLQLAFHGILVIAVASVVEVPLVLAASSVSRVLLQSERMRLLFQRILGTVLIGLGAQLILSGDRRS